MSNYIVGIINLIGLWNGWEGGVICYMSNPMYVQLSRFILTELCLRYYVMDSFNLFQRSRSYRIAVRRAVFFSFVEHKIGFSNISNILYMILTDFYRCRVLVNIHSIYFLSFLTKRETI